MEAQCLGTTVHYELSGSGAKKVVLLHGWGCSTELMAPIAAGLEADMTVLNLDFPGFGKSGRPPQPWGVPEYAACIRELLEQLHFLPCSVIAHSFGGRVAIWLASSGECPFEKLILTGAAGIRKPATPESERRSAEFKKKKEQLQRLKKLPLLGGLAASMEEKLRQQYGSADYNALDEEMRRTFVKVINLDLTDRLPAVAAPTLLMWGTADTETPLWMGKKMEELIPDAGLVELSGGTHFAYLEQQARFVQVARVFLLEQN